MSGELEAVAEDHALDAVLVQVPYCTQTGSVPQPPNGRVVAHSGGNGPRTAAILVRRKDCDVLSLEELMQPYCAVAQLTVRGHDPIYLVSVYLRPRGDLEEELAHLDRIFGVLRGTGQPILVGADVNASHPLWHATGTGRRQISRGWQVVDLVAAAGMTILNKEGEPDTYIGYCGTRANLDVTMCSMGLEDSLKFWKVHPHATMSDHSLITMAFTGLGGTRESGPLMMTKRYLLAKADWDGFDRHLADSLDGWSPGIEDEADLEAAVGGLTTRLTEACDAWIPNPSSRRRLVRWWSPALDRLRRALRRKGRAADHGQRPGAREEYRVARNHYRKQIRKAQSESWRDFVTIRDSENPWGKAYKVLTGKLRVERILSGLRLPGLPATTDVVGTAEALVARLLPDDDPGVDTPWQSEVRRRATEDAVGRDVEAFTDGELTRALYSMALRKAPGADGLSVEIYRRSWCRVRDQLLRIMNAMLRVEAFPSLWKRGDLRILLKASDKDPSNPKSYRPLALLPVMGKIAEKLIATRLTSFLDGLPAGRQLSRRQYGFRNGVGTQDALVRVVTKVRTSYHRYVLGIFLDISGAFDSAWWPGILWKLRRLGCPGNLYGLLRSYLSGRVGTLVLRTQAIEKNLTKGCPQSSILGPLLWRIAYDDFLKLDLGAGVTSYAYADDGLLLIEANTRLSLETLGAAALDRVFQWGDRNKLSFAPDKTKMVLLKGKYSSPTLCTHKRREG